MSDWSAKNPYSSNLTENFVLNGEGSRKETRHIVFDLGDSGLQYKAGDALGVIPRCPPGRRTPPASRSSRATRGSPRA